jgi:hypothetical protein
MHGMNIKLKLSVYTFKSYKGDQRTSLKHADYKITKPQRKKGRIGVLIRHIAGLLKNSPTDTNITA